MAVLRNVKHGCVNSDTLRVCAPYKELKKGHPISKRCGLMDKTSGLGAGRWWSMSHNLKNGKEGSEDTEESPAGCNKLENLLKISYLSILYII